MTTDFFPASDDLNEILTAPTTPKALPVDAQLTRIREQGIGLVPVAKAFRVTCAKCNGRGRFVSYAGRDCGPCFTCKGKGFKETKTSPTVLAANREKAAVRKDNRAQENWDTFVQAHPALANVLTKGLSSKNERWGDICSDIINKVRKYGDLHQGTMEMLQRSADRDAQWAAQRQEQAAQGQQQVQGIDVANIVACFQQASEAGLKTFTLRFDGVHFQADKREAGLIWVSEAGYGSAKFGRIQGGVYKPGRDFNPAVAAKIALISADPMAAAKAYAQVTSSCSVCGRHLENQVSVEEGIGPICAGRLNHKPGAKMVPVEQGDF